MSGISPDSPHSERWASYFYPPPDQNTLRNLDNIRGAGWLMVLDYNASNLRRNELLESPELVARTYDAEHLRALHRHLFQDVYEWAGEYRIVNMVKEGDSRGFGDFRSGEIDQLLGDAHRVIARTDWAGINERDFVDAAAEVFAWVNQAHPFREGNGRTAKVFMEHVAELSPYELQFSQVDPDMWNLASKQSSPAKGVYAPDPAPLRPVFQAATSRRAPAAKPALPSLQELTFPRPATEAVRQPMNRPIPPARGTRRSAGYGVER